MNNDFQKFAMSNGVSSLTLHDYTKGINAGYQCPSIIETSQMHGTTLDIFSRLMADRIIFLGTNVSPESANIITSQLLYLDNNGKGDISIYINSPGGDVYSGLQIYDTMQYINSDVSTICAGLAASMGSVLLCAGTAGKRFALPHSRVMIHQPLGGAKGQASDILIEAREIEKCRDELYSIISEHSGQPFEKVFADADRNFWMNSQKALEYGMIDRILGKKSESAKK